MGNRRVVYRMGDFGPQGTSAAFALAANAGRDLPGQTGVRPGMNVGTD
ncbi:MAG TPA: hypothetical protein VNM47_06605 [Terriglobia bacterium]|nr:hypothetical protein [Terriglobia bacterium]